MSLRTVRRAVVLAFSLASVIIRFWLLGLSGRRTLERRALWAQASSRRVLASMGVGYSVEGVPPMRGLVVSNHLSYLDILFLSAAMPCFFVAKKEIGGWPIFGKAARACGTLFLDRSSLASANAVAGQMRERFKLPIPLLLFPEGTSTDGTRVLRFHSRLIAPAIASRRPITAAAIRYVIEDGSPERELCWFGNAAFLPHLLKALGTAGFSARVSFGQPRLYSDTRLAAGQTQVEVNAMREAATLKPENIF